MAFDPSRDYPLGARRPDLVRTPGGLPLDALTLAALRDGDIDGDELRATPETLRLQAEVAEAAGRAALAANLRRAAEAATLSDETILDLYTALRPRRSSSEELEAWARRLEDDWHAPLTAAFVREAATVYEARGLLARLEGDAADAPPPVRAVPAAESPGEGQTAPPSQHERSGAAAV